MQIIKLDATESTNQYLDELFCNIDLEDYSMVVSKYQSRGRGQFGNFWYSEKDKNLLISILKKNIDICIKDQFYINIRVSLSVYMTMKFFKVPNISIKWPNDILSCEKKIAGILIKFALKHKLVRYAIIGLGINVNQTSFNNLPNASSMKCVLGNSIEIDKLRTEFIKYLKYYFKIQDKDELLMQYNNLLFRKDQLCDFKMNNGTFFKAKIICVQSNGKLQLRINETIKDFDLKSIKMIY